MSRDLENYEAYQRAYYLANKPKVLARNRAWREKNKAKVKSDRRKRYLLNIAKIKDYNRKRPSRRRYTTLSNLAKIVEAVKILKNCLHPQPEISK